MDSLSRLEGKAAKVLGKSNQSEYIHIYKICSENLGGRSWLTRFSRSSEKDEDTSSNSSRCSVSDETSNSDKGLMMKCSDDKEFSPTKFVSTKPRRQMLVLSDTKSSGQILQVTEDYNNSIFCISPDSGMHDDFNSPPTTIKSKDTSLLQLNAYYTSSPSILTRAPSQV